LLLEAWGSEIVESLQSGVNTAPKIDRKMKELIGIALIATAVYFWFQLMPDPVPSEPRHRARVRDETTITAIKPTPNPAANQPASGSLADRWKQ
jgi:hypothetical protein